MKKFPIQGKKKKFDIAKFCSQVSENILPRIYQRNRDHSTTKIVARKIQQVDRAKVLQHRLSGNTKRNVRQQSNYSKKTEASYQEQNSFTLEKNNSKHSEFKALYEFKSESNSRLKKVLSKKKKNRKQIKQIKKTEQLNSQKQNHATQQLKLLFIKIQDKLKPSPQKHSQIIPPPPAIYPRSQSLTNLTNISQIFHHGVSCSVMTSPRDIFRQKSQTNKDLNSIVNSIPLELEKLEQVYKKCQVNFKKYILEKVRMIDVHCFLGTLENRGKARRYQKMR